MLLISRRAGQAITIQPGQGLDLVAPVAALFRDGPIAVQVNRIVHDEVRLGIAAHRDLVILREELARHHLLGMSAPSTKCSATPSPAANPSTSHTHNRHRHLSSREILARNIMRLCEQQHWPIARLVEASHLSLTTLFAIEQGKGVISLDDLENLAHAFGVSVYDLLRPMNAL